MTPHPQAIVLVPFVSRAIADEAAARLLERDHEKALVVTDGEMGSYLNARTGEVGYRIELRGDWVVDEQRDGKIVLRCKKADAPLASQEGEDGGV